VDTRAAYWITDENGNLQVYNGNGQYLDIVPKNAAGDFVARFNQGQNDMAKDYRPGASSGSDNGPAWANIGLRGRELEQSGQQFGAKLAEDQRQFDQTMGKDKSMFDQNMALQQATQKWREATDARDFEAANFWKSRAQELQQNSLALENTKLMASLSGPQDWIKYGRLSRGESPLGTPDGQTVPLDQAGPAWARGVMPGTYGYGPETMSSRGFGGSQGGAGAGASALPAWAQPKGQAGLTGPVSQVGQRAGVLGSEPTGGFKTPPMFQNVSETNTRDTSGGQIGGVNPGNVLVGYADPKTGALSATPNGGKAIWK